MKNIAIIGYKDSSVGQLINMLDFKLKKKLNCVIVFSKITPLNIKEEQKKRPNKKTEFIVNNKIFNLPVFYCQDLTKIFKRRKIKYIFVMEDKGYQRRIIFKKIKKEKIKILNFIHKSVKLMGKNNIGEGTIIFPDCYIGYKSDIGDGCILQSGCRIEHHNSIGNFCDINPNLTTGGFTKIGNFCEINISVDIINKIIVGEHSRIGAGSLVLKDIDNNQLYYGRPARFIKKIKENF